MGEAIANRLLGVVGPLDPTLMEERTGLFLQSLELGKTSAIHEGGV